MLAETLRFWRTVRHLRSTQWVGRVRHMALRPTPNLTPAPDLREGRGVWQRPSGRAASLVGPHRFRFLNEERRIAGRADWNRTDCSKLWLYNLHYLDDLNADGAQDRLAWHLPLIRRWIEENPPGSGNGWEPYCLSLRIVNWLKWQLHGRHLDGEALQSVAIQVRFLLAQIETHLLGNHLFANLKALIFAGAVFDGAEAARWLAVGRAHLKRELGEQVLADGGHFERSPMYHSIILEDVLDLVQLAGMFPGVLAADEEVALRECATAMISWLEAMTHPDGEIAFFNDAAFGIALPASALRDYAERLNISAAALPPVTLQLAPSGYVRVQAGSAVVIADVAPIGPDHIPGHAHADTLSFELSIDGRRFLVNSGTSCYGEGQERLRQRGTAAHNTVVVDGMDSSEVWAGFRVARRAYPLDVRLAVDPQATTLDAGHDGYDGRLAGVRHHRRWRMGSQRLVVTDMLSGSYGGAHAYFHLHPEVRVEDSSPGAVRLRLGNRTIMVHIRGAQVDVASGTWHPRFGVTRTNTRLVLLFEQRTVETCWSW
jgi:uncharacterized heparinase superfamily protein